VNGHGLGLGQPRPLQSRCYTRAGACVRWGNGRCMCRGRCSSVILYPFIYFSPAYSHIIQILHIQNIALPTRTQNRLVIANYRHYPRLNCTRVGVKAYLDEAAADAIGVIIIPACHVIYRWVRVISAAGCFTCLIWPWLLSQLRFWGGSGKPAATAVISISLHVLSALGRMAHALGPLYDSAVQGGPPRKGKVHFKTRAFQCAPGAVVGWCVKP
jgi:hypothetical protein